MNDKNRLPESQTIEDILRERNRLEEVIQERFKKEQTILFSDICGYTRYTETMGDLASRAMVQKHNDLLFPLIEKYGGTVIKTIGDAVMARFDDPLKAVRSAVAIQKVLKKHNRSSDTSDRIYVKIGLNTGLVIMEATDVFGDAVNVAARVQSKAVSYEILVSKDLYEHIRGSGEILCRYHGAAELKGKAVPMELYRVIWEPEKPEEKSEKSPDPKLRSRKDRQSAKNTLKVIHIELSLMEDHLKIGCHEQMVGETRTARHYQEIVIPLDDITLQCRKLADTLTKANQKEAPLKQESLKKLIEIGKNLFNSLFPEEVRNDIQNTDAEHMIINMDEHMVAIPWELLHTANEFLCRRFSMGRLVKTRQTVQKVHRDLSKPLHMMIIANPSEDLKEAQLEGIQLKALLASQKEMVNAVMPEKDITAGFIRERIGKFDLIHFAGHAEYDEKNPSQGGWRLNDGVFSASEIMNSEGLMPCGVFSNACHSAKTTEWVIKEDFHDHVFGLANAFILKGVRHYVGACWEIQDQSSRRFAGKFYENILTGKTVGESVRKAREYLAKEYGEESIFWAGYILYGDPGFNYVDQIYDIKDASPLSQLEKKKSSAVSKQKKQIQKKQIPKKQKPKKQKPVKLNADKKISKRHLENAEEKQRSASLKTGKIRTIAISSVFLLMTVGIFFFVWQNFFHNLDTSNLQAAVTSDYAQGRFDSALDGCADLEEKNSDLRMAKVIRGHILFRTGKPEHAEAAYREALTAQQGTDMEKAEALIGLGRIASIRNQQNDALAFYDKAAQVAPSKGGGYLAGAMLYEKKGQLDKAIEWMNMAKQAVPDDKMIPFMARKIQNRLDMKQDSEEQARVDSLVNELIAQMDSGTNDEVTDGWSSRPLTVWVMDIATSGYSLQEGEDRILKSAVEERLIESGSMEVVERAILETLLEEIKFGTSKLTDRNAALQLGRMLAVRIILSGKLIYAGHQKQVSLRVIETETGRIIGSFNETVPGAIPASDLADRIFQKLSEKIKNNYTLRGKITKISEDGIELNIGSRVGVWMGQNFLVKNKGTVLEIISLWPEKSTAAVIVEKSKPAEGMRVEVLKQK